MSSSSEKLAAVRAKHRRPNPRRGAAAEEGDADDRLAQFEKERAEWRAQNGVGPGGEGKLTVEQVQTYARKLETQNEETLERTIATAAEAEKVGAETLQKLDSQNQQLRKMDGDLKDMNVTMSRSERILHGMKSWGNSIMNSFTTPKKPLDTSYEGSGAAAKDAAKRVNESAATKPSATTPTASASASASDAKSTAGKAGGDAKFGEFEPVRGRPHNPRTDAVLAETRSAKVDAQLDQLSNIVGTLHAQATAMGTSINESSDLIDHIDGVVDHTTHRVTRATRKAQRILDDN